MMNPKSKKAVLLTAVVLGTALCHAAARAAPPESMVVWRVQLAIGVCDSSNAGTDDRLSAQLNPLNLTVLDQPGSDFRRGSVHEYDLLPSTLLSRDSFRVIDVSQLRLSKGGSDGVTVCSVRLRLNERTAFFRSFSPAGIRLDTGSGYSPVLTITGAQLRADPAWVSYTPPAPPTLIGATAIRSRIESTVATAMDGGRLRWRSSGASVTRADDTAVHVGLALKARVRGWFDPDVDVDFDLRFSCSGGRIEITLEDLSVDVDSRFIAEVLSFGFIEAIENRIEEGVRSAFTGVTFSGSVGVPICPRISVLADGSVRFSL
jgi:hypothetical protein